IEWLFEKGYDIAVELLVKGHAIEAGRIDACSRCRRGECIAARRQKREMSRERHHVLVWRGRQFPADDCGTPLIDGDTILGCTPHLNRHSDRRKSAFFEGHTQSRCSD